MVRGFLSGIVLGGAVGAVGLSLVSLVSEPPPAGALVAGMAEAVPDAAQSSVPEVVAEPVPVVVPDVAPAPAPAPVPENAPPAAGADAPPQAPLAAPAPDQAATPPAPPTVTAPPAPPVALDQPGPEAAPVAAEVPAAPVVVADNVAPAAPMDPEAAPDSAELPGQPLGNAPDLPELAALPAAPGAETPLAEADQPPLPPLTAEEEALLKRLGDGTGDAQPDVTDPTPKVEDLPDAEAEPAPEPEPAPAPAPAVTATVEPTPGLEPSPGLTNAVEGVTINRLPRIGTAPAAGGQAATATPPELDPRPMVQFARRFENPTQKPVFAIILLDTGAADVDRAALARLPFPVSFAIDPLDPSAADHAAIYRAGGQEVLMLATGVPEGAQAQDLEVAFGVMATGLPEAVAVIDTPAGQFQGNRLLAGQVVPLVAAQGRGLVTWDRGLNAADQVARREGLPATVAFRALDAEGEAAPVIRRYLDRAAFKAAQEGRVTVIGTTRPETIAALLEWAVEGRSATVALAPVTAVLTTD